MRRVSVYQQKAKLRGVKRRLRAVDRWADSFEGYFPSEYGQKKYWNWKLPVADSLVGPPLTTNQIQSHCAKAMLRAVQHMLNSRPEEYDHTIVSALISYPQMFSSEVCVFSDREYFDSFYSRSGDWQSLAPIEGRQLSKVLNFDVADSLTQSGYLHRVKDECEGQMITYEEQWWSFYSN